MLEVCHGMRVYRCPFAELFRPLTTAEASGLRESIAAIGVGHPIFTYDSETWGADCVIDGANRLRLADELGIGVEVEKLSVSDETARRLAEDLNILRRQVTPSEAEAARAKRLERIERVVAARQEGKSLRTIAKQEEISPQQVQRDLDDSGVTPPVTPDGKSDTPPVVEGTDGKQYPASRPSPFYRDGKPVVPPQRDPDHPYAKLLQQIVNLASVISATCNDEADDSKLRQYLLNMSFVFPRAKIVNGRNYGWKCVGLRGLYRAVQLAGLPGKAKSKAQLLKAVSEAMDPDGDKE